MHEHQRPRAAHTRRQVVGMLIVIAALNLVGWGTLLLVVVPHDYRIGDAGIFGVGVGLTAFLLGARHAFDADHIAIIDNATRKLVGEGKAARTTGLWFALGHSSVVFGLAAVIALGVTAIAGPVQDADSSLQHVLGVIGSSAAGLFLVVVGLMNLSALGGIIHARRHLKAGTFDEHRLEHHLHNRGFLARIFGRVTRRIDKPWHLYPAGLLMGLGFDTATQIALLVLAGGTAAYALPWYAVMVLPVLFTAGMVLGDSIDGVVMSRAYEWSSLDPARRIVYNMVVTTLSVLIALTIGTVLLLQLVADELSPAWLTWVEKVNLDYVGFAIVAVFVAVWATGVTVVGAARSRRATADA
ncbi:HoxN/HupN/NixA family nickel/cobalt transporter [Nocardioides jiangxiensis]|uniref:Nickel/cobalt efflux system n=1 Tax=Nocardioides jiangxiensis TaxID=3064524 RepID=A0ABT9B0D4_9ACTN|nr:HoxN/HupN/NixA family nickel/cobalt transporter [Nocardioides sp. WY-20]MDO7868311.1 HoxN/HupN/NixA family nickel/cobalt transporter [Nocardioides sp. WY-20]